LKRENGHAQEGQAKNDFSQASKEGQDFYHQGKIIKRSNETGRTASQFAYKGLVFMNLRVDPTSRRDNKKGC